MVISIRRDHIHHQPEVLYHRQQLPYHKTLSYVHLTASTVGLIPPHSPGKRSPPHTPEKRSADEIFVTQTVPPVSEYGIISQLAGQRQFSQTSLTTQPTVSIQNSDSAGCPLVTSASVMRVTSGSWRVSHEDHMARSDLGSIEHMLTLITAISSSGMSSTMSMT